MSLAATLAADGMRPASFLPSIKCSNCGDEIEISRMGDHACGRAAEPAPESPKSTHSSLSNPFTLRAMNASGSKPAQPSPLQFDSPPPQPQPQERARAPTLGSSYVPNSKAPRPAPPRINADVANMPFLAPAPRSETPISPATSSRSGSSLGGKPPPPIRSMTSPMPRLWDPRPPSPELSANLDCAFPPFPFSESKGGSRPSTSSGRRTPTGSERSSSRATSRLDSKPPDLPDIEPKGPMSKAGENVITRMNTLKSGPFDPTRRRPSNEDRQQLEQKPLDRRRPSSPEDSLSDGPPPLPSTSIADSFQLPPLFHTESNSSDASEPSIEAPKAGIEKKTPPERPARPTDSLTPSILDKLSAEPVSALTSVFPPPPAPAPLRTTDRSRTFPSPADGKDEPDALPTLSKMPSEPALRNRERRPTLTSTSASESSQSEQFPPRSQSRNEERMDHRLQDAPPVPKSIQLHRSDSRHTPSGSDSSTVSSSNSLRNTNSSGGPSPVTSAASSMDAFSPLDQEIAKHVEDPDTRMGVSRSKSQVRPGMRAEQPKERSPPRNFARPSPPREIAMPAMESPIVPGASNWPLESPMDPAMQNGKIAATPASPAPASSAANLKPKTVATDLSLDLSLSPASFSSDDYDPYRARTPQSEQPPQPLHTRGRSKTSNGPQSRPFDAPVLSRSRTEQPVKAPPFTERGPRSQVRSPPPVQAPPIPQEAPRPQLTRRQTSGGKATCRGCNLQIEGKSVKAADGRLTGRWHKACFVCKTCQEPFTTADFYVIKNNPYCEQHYHEKNGSLCQGCQKGIEGQYLETASSTPGGRVEKKYHPRCFTCFSCRMVLAEDYFEIGGRVFCERHALAAMRAQPKNVGPGGSSLGPSGPGRPGRSGLAPPGPSALKAERRTTKLMTMS